MLGIGLSRVTGGLLAIGMVSGFILTLTSRLGIGRFVASYIAISEYVGIGVAALLVWIVCTVNESKVN